MGFLSKVANGLVLVGVASLGLIAGRTNVRPLVSEAFADQVAALEVSAAREGTPDAIRTLATAYLDRNEPGLATAVLEGAPSATRSDPGVSYARARALYARGRTTDALAELRGVERQCDDHGACPIWLSAKITRQTAFLEALQEMGVEDPAAQPELAREALERARRRGRVVAIAMR